MFGRSQLFAEPRISNQVIHVAGDTVTYRKVADTVDAVLGIKVRRDEWTVPDLIRQLDEKPQDALRKYRVVFAQGRGVAIHLSAAIRYETFAGHEPTLAERPD
jgi:hypothetical protein